MRIFRRPPEAASREFLRECGLPVSDLESHNFEDFFGCRGDEGLRGVVGLEVFGAVALLRSLAVAEDARGSGCGSALVAESEAHAKTRGVTELYLLTDTAEEFFVRLGYSLVDRNLAPEPIERTAEFSHLCPGTAAFMMKRLAGR